MWVLTVCQNGTVRGGVYATQKDALDAVWDITFPLGRHQFFQETLIRCGYCTDDVEFVMMLAKASEC